MLSVSSCSAISSLPTGALLVALYSMAVHESRLRALLAAAVLEAGAIMAAVRWEPAGSVPRSFLFLSAVVVAALFAGLTMASGSRYLAWLTERAHRLEVERDQQATIATTAERTRIAREMHDVVSHSLSPSSRRRRLSGRRFRFIQEALTNTLKHAAASRAWITIRYESSAVHVEVADDGIGRGNTEHSGHGIEGTRERVAFYGGHVQAAPGAGGGWIVSARLPVSLPTAR